MSNIKSPCLDEGRSGLALYHMYKASIGRPKTTKQYRDEKLTAFNKIKPELIKMLGTKHASDRHK